MVTAVPSRFAVLCMEDDDYKPTKKTQKPTNTKNNTKSVKEEKQKQPKKDDKKKQNKGKKKKTASDNQQWEQWKQKDSVAVEETYEQELHEAILLSKLSYQESQNDVPSKSENSKNNNKKLNSKKSKKSTMSLEEFNNLNSPATSNLESNNEKKINSKELDTRFFEKIEKETSHELIKEKEKATLTARLNQVDDNITSACLRHEIEKRDEIVKKLREEVESLRQELSNVRHRNKKLYQILQQGEMKDKAAILAEVTKLQEIRDELTSEVTSLHAQLEQERSKARAPSTDTRTTKQTNKKRLTGDNV